MTMTIREMKESFGQCYSATCSNDYTHVVSWPTEREPPKYCHDCTSKLLVIAKMMGLVLHVSEVTKTH